MIKKLFSLLLAAVMAFGLLPTGASAAGPTVISSQEELAAITMEGTYILGGDITLEGEWTPLGTITAPFIGSFDGDGYTVSELTITNPTEANQGLFGAVGKTGTIQNVTVDGTISGATNYTGGIVGKCSGTILNCINKVTITGSANAQYVGGIVGSIEDTNAGPKITGCANFGAITAKNNVGGIAGQLKNAQMSNCYNVATISNLKSGRSLGGLVGYTTGGGSIQNSYMAGDLSIAANSNVGCLVGWLYGATADNCYYVRIGETPANMGSGETTNCVMETADVIKDPSFLTTLNLSSPEGSAFVEDRGNINGGYPILECQLPKTAQYALQISATPGTAAIVVRSSESQTQNGVNGAYKLPNGSYTYWVSAFGYVPATGTLTVDGADLDPIAVTLAEAERQAVTLRVTPGDAQIVVSHAAAGEQTPEADGTYRLPAGDYTYTAIAKDYTPKTDGSFTVAAAAVEEIVTLTPLAPAAAWDGATKTPVAPIGGVFYLQNGAELAWFADQVDEGRNSDSKVVLLRDIDLGEKVWNAIGGYGFPFTGNFDGNGCQILNIRTNGLFYQLGKSGSADGGLENLIVSGSISGSSNVGGIVAVNYGILRNCAGAVTVSATGQRVGGLVGNNSGGTILGCANTGAVSTGYDSYANTVNLGGVAGQNSGTIENCYNTAAVTATGRNHNGGVGGITGENSGSVNNSYSAGTVGYLYDPDNGNGPRETDKATGALVGISSGTVVNSLYRTDSCTYGIGAGGGSKDGATARTADELKSRAAALTLNGGSADGPFYLAETAQQNGGYPVLKWQGGKAPAANSDEAAVATDKAALALPQPVYVEAVTIPLPASGAQGSTITWESGTPATISNGGAIVLPLEGKAEVVLTATLKKGDATGEKAFTVTVYSPKQTTLNYLAAAKAALGSGHLVPVYGRDTNLVDMVQEKLSDSGFSDVTATLTTAGITGVGDSTYVATNGDVTYFYRDPGSGTGNSAAVTGIAFSLEKAGERVPWDNVVANIYWDRAKVTEQLNGIANRLTWGAIKGSNTDERQITLPLSLPLRVDDKGWATILWETDGGDVLNIPAAPVGNYDPLTAAIYRPQVDTGLKLTVTVSFNLTNTISGGEAEITVARTLPLVVKGNGVDSTAQMRENLNHNYTLEKIKDSTTGLVIDPAAVVGDLQLPMPKNTGVPDYSAYRFTAVSKDPDVLVVNGYRGVVYRPMPGEGAVTVGFTVTMTGRANASLSVSKDFEITVLPLKQREIDDGLKLMEAVRTDYSSAILGAGSTKDAVIGNMNPFNEAVFDEAGTALIYSRALRDDTGRGVMIDDLPGSAPGGPGYEKWRTFQSGRPDLLLHESLHLEQQPTYDTTVTITSVLTHEVLGKYAAKYPKNKDLQALYQIEVRAVVTVKGSSERPNPNPDESFSACFAVDGKGHIDSIGEREITGLKEGETAFDLLRKVFAANGFTYEGGGRYLTAVTDSKGKKVGELDHGPNSGWMYQVNGAYTGKMLDEYYLTGGEKIKLYYVDDYIGEPGTPPDDGNVTDKKNPEVNREGEAVFADVSQQDWFYGAVRFVTERGLFFGTTETAFDPDTDMSRAMLVTVLHRLAGKPAATKPAAFADVAAGTWYTDGVSWAAEQNLIAGTGDGFDPNGTLTRETLAVMLYRYAIQKGYDGTKTGDLSQFTDSGKVSDWAKSAMTWAVGAGLFAGRAATTLAPDGVATRAETAAVLWRFVTGVVR